MSRMIRTITRMVPIPMYMPTPFVDFPVVPRGVMRKTHASGSSTVKIDPRSSAAATEIVPPICSTSARQM